MNKKTAAQLLEIAKKHSFEVATRGDLERRMWDDEDFLEVSVWGLKVMLEDAYKLGKQTK
ncbi:hypothetical protein QS713_08890 [Gleimia hominis]|uniref:DUF6900 domain-containing protein n=1 Tax=Gleimia hominis TaxID=595468 RepID=A0ABU3ICT0_9ACTO|nr:hypothetical protein [Gleimia hominis]MDT3768174.1 hypothetical protein [Gleimia hominis]